MVKSDAESQTSDVSLTQGFEPQEDDEETLWEVIEITGEKPKYYKVRWKGTDPATLKPWAQSWVPKKDCTDDLVLEWKRKQKEKEKDRRKCNVYSFYKAYEMISMYDSHGFKTREGIYSI